MDRFKLVFIFLIFYAFSFKGHGVLFNNNPIFHNDKRKKESPLSFKNKGRSPILWTDEEKESFFTPCSFNNINPPESKKNQYEQLILHIENIQLQKALRIFQEDPNILQYWRCFPLEHPTPFGVVEEYIRALDSSYDFRDIPSSKDISLEAIENSTKSSKLKIKLPSLKKTITLLQPEENALLLSPFDLHKKSSNQPDSKSKPQDNENPLKLPPRLQGTSSLGHKMEVKIPKKLEGLPITIKSDVLKSYKILYHLMYKYGSLASINSQRNGLIYHQKKDSAKQKNLIEAISKNDFEEVSRIFSSKDIRVHFSTSKRKLSSLPYPLEHIVNLRNEQENPEERKNLLKIAQHLLDQGLHPNPEYEDRPEKNLDLTYKVVAYYDFDMMRLLVQHKVSFQIWDPVTKNTPFVGVFEEANYPLNSPQSHKMIEKLYDNHMSSYSDVEHYYLTYHVLRQYKNLQDKDKDKEKIKFLDYLFYKFTKSLNGKNILSKKEILQDFNLIVLAVLNNDIKKIKFLFSKNLFNLTENLRDDQAILSYLGLLKSNNVGFDVFFYFLKQGFQAATKVKDDLSRETALFELLKAGLDYLQKSSKSQPVLEAYLLAKLPLMTQEKIGPQIGILTYTRGLENENLYMSLINKVKNSLITRNEEDQFYRALLKESEREHVEEKKEKLKSFFLKTIQDSNSNVQNELLFLFALKEKNTSLLKTLLDKREVSLKRRFGTNRDASILFFILDELNRYDFSYEDFIYFYKKIKERHIKNLKNHISLGMTKGSYINAAFYRHLLSNLLKRKSMESKRDIDSDVIDQRKRQLDRMFYELASKFKNIYNFTIVPKEFSIMYWALENKDFYMVKYLIEEKGYDVNTRYIDYTVPLHYATEFQLDYEVFDYLFEKTKNPRKKALNALKRLTISSDSHAQKETLNNIFYSYDDYICDIPIFPIRRDLYIEPDFYKKTEGKTCRQMSFSYPLDLKPLGDFDPNDSFVYWAFKLNDMEKIDFLFTQKAFNPRAKATNGFTYFWFSILGQNLVGFIDVLKRVGPEIAHEKSKKLKISALKYLELTIEKAEEEQKERQLTPDEEKEVQCYKSMLDYATKFYGKEVKVVESCQLELVTD